MKLNEKSSKTSGLLRAKGIIESIDITPVWNGSNSDCLSIIPGAKDSITQRYSHQFYGHLK